MIAAGTVIDGRYRVIAKLGSGGMADVYLAHDELLGRQVAVKVLQDRFAGDQQFVERFRREASAAASLSHPNIVAIFDRGSWDGTYYIAMEYLPGKTLKELVREEGPLPPSQAIEIAIQVLRAAAYAHRHGVIHRDLKPHNIILAEEGRVVVTDFGIARAASDGEITQVGSIMGTAQYLSPEQAEGGKVSEASDIYAVGVLLYELLTGTVPFQGDSAVAVALQHLSTPPRPPSLLNPAVPRQLDQVVLRALAKNPADRYPSAQSFIDALTAAGQTIALPTAPIDQQPTEAIPALVPQEEDGKGRRRWWLGLLVAAVAAGGAVAGLLLSKGEPAKVVVPALIGQSQAQAVQELRADGLVGVAIPQTSTAPPGTVVGQRPQAGTVVAKGSYVYLTVSVGAQTALIPKVVGLPQHKAEAVLRAAGFVPVAVSQPSKRYPPGTVIGTSPPEAVEAQKGATVVLYVSSGPPPAQGAVTVPDVVGLSQSAAEEALTAVGLSAQVVGRRESGTAPPGTVLVQTPAAGGKVAKGGTVSLIVATRPQLVTVPNVVGKQEAQAAAELGAAGFKVATRNEPVAEPEAVGQVVEQVPPAGLQLRPGEKVTIVVGVLQHKTTTTTTTSSAARKGEGEG